MRRFQKPFAIIILLGIMGTLLPVSFTLNPSIQRAHAVIPVADVGNAPTHTISLFEQIISVVQQIFEWTQTFILSALKKRILDMIVDQIIKWIQGGGKPQFVSNWGDFVKTAANAAIGDVAREVGLGALCEPFSGHFRFAMGIGFSPFPVQTFSEAITCTLDDIVGNIHNFYNDFRNGSFVAFNVAWLPQNNIYGGLLLAYDRELSLISERTGASINEAVSGGGFLSVKKCRRLPDGTEQCALTTPGRVLGDTVARGVTADIDYIVNAEQLADYVTAIADAALNRVIQLGLAAATTRNAPPGGVIPRGSGGACAGLSGAALALCQSYQRSQGGPQGQNVYTIELDQIIFERGRATTTIQGIITSLNGYLRVLDNPAPPGFIQQLTGLNCVERSSYLSEVRTDITWAQNTITELRARLTQNNAIITALTTARTRILPLVPPARSTPDFAAVEQILSPLRNNGYLNLPAAANENGELASLEGEVSQRISINTQTHRDNIDLCRTGP